MTLLKLKETHPKIYRKIIAYSNNSDYNIYKISDNLDLISALGNFNWNLTPEGIDVWLKIFNLNFNPFYEFYNTKYNHKLVNILPCS